MTSHERRTAWYVLPLIVALCACASLLSVIALQLASERQHAHADDVATDAQHIRILDRQFTAAEIARGQAVYLQHCAACHGAEGQGQFPDAPLQPDNTGRYGAPPHDPTGHTWHHSDVLLVRYVMEGGFSDPARFYPMPAFGALLNEDEVLFVIAYIKTLWTDEQRLWQRQVTEEEQRLFNE